MMTTLAPRICRLCGVAEISRGRSAPSYCSPCGNKRRREQRSAKAATLTCPECDASFKAFGTRKYCGPECKKNAGRRKQGWIVGGEIRSCEWCASDFSPARGAQRFCSEKCMWGSINERRRDDDSYREAKRAWARANPEIMLAASRRWRVANPEKHRDACRKWADNNQEHMREVAAAWRRANRAHLVLKEAKRRARKRLASVGTITPDDLDSKAAVWGSRCWMCGGSWSAWDHVKPLAAGGPHILANLRPACASCNSRKGARWRGADALSTFKRAETKTDK